MLSLPTQHLHFMGGDASLDQANWVMVGVPYDGTCSYRPGARFAPNAIREASWGLETYSPELGKSLDDVAFYDAGDLEFPFGNREKSLEHIKAVVGDVLSHNKRWLGLGGEHLITLPTLQAYIQHYPDLALIQFDAHTDLREDYLGEPLSHATVIRRVSEFIPPERMAQIGIRSGVKEEWDWMDKHHTLAKSFSDLEEKLTAWGDRPIFLTIDLDVLDPSIFPGTGTPEPGGFTFKELMQWLFLLQNKNLVGMDIVELSPHYDPSGVSSITAAKLVREALLLNF